MRRRLARLLLLAANRLYPPPMATNFHAADLEVVVAQQNFIDAVRRQHSARRRRFDGTVASD